MKNSMFVGVMSLAIVCTACNGGGGSGSGNITATINNGNNPNATNCTTSLGGGNLVMTCDSGMTITAPVASLAPFVGATGAAGAAGPQGASGNMWKLYNGNGSQVGDYLLGGIGTATSGYTVWDQANGVAVGYSYNGQPYSGSLYFTSVNCSGIAYAVNTTPINSVFHNTGVFYKVTSTTANHTFQSYIADGQACAVIGGAGTTATYAEVGTYSNASMPSALTLPVTISE
jgi:hypothetical protein